MAESEGAEQFKLTLRGNGVEINREIDQRQLAAIMSVLMGGGVSADSSPDALAGMQVEESVEISLREFLDQVKASRKSDLIVAIGHYISLHEGQQTFSRDDIKARFAAAREPMPANFPRDLAVAIKSGMIAEAHQKTGHYYVTKTGIQAVERHFGSELRR